MLRQHLRIELEIIGASPRLCLMQSQFIIIASVDNYPSTLIAIVSGYRATLDKSV